jgi:beta-glucanase (GH16 family)
MSPPNPMIQEEAGEHAVFLATSNRYAVRGGLVPVPAGLNGSEGVWRGIFLIDPKGESSDNESLLDGLRTRGVGEAVWSFTQNVFSTCGAQASSSPRMSCEGL